MACDIVTTCRGEVLIMGNVAPLLKKIHNLEAHIQILEDLYLDKREKYVMNKDVGIEGEDIGRYLGDF